MTTRPLQAVLMAGGRGTRLYPYTAVLPKPLLPVGDKPVLELLLKRLQAQGIVSVAIAVNHLRQLIQSFFGDGSALGMRIEYAVEDVPLGTCGPVGALLDRMAPDFLVLNGDLMTDMDFTGLLDWHRAQNAAATVAAARRQEQLEYGALEIAGDHSLLNIREKPRTEWLVSMGLYALRRDALRERIPAMQPLDMPDLLLRLKEEGERVMVLPTEAMWIDIGRPDDYARAQAMFEVERKAAISATARQGLPVQ